MLTNDLSNNNIPASAPPPPPPLPLGGLKNWTLPQDNGNSKKPSNVATSGISSRIEAKKGQSKSPVQQSSLNFAENPLFKKKQEEHNVNSETADEGSNIRQSEPNRGLTPKPVSPRVLSPQQDNANSNKPSGTNNSTQSEKGLSENPIQLATEQKIDTPILVNTSVGISKATALKYSIATLLLCISSVTAGIYTYLSISVTLSDPVLFTVIASVSSLVVLSLAAYLINSHLSAINSEKKVDPGRKQSQYSELQKEAESLGHSNTPIPSLEMSGTPSAPPPPPPLPQNAAPLPPRPTASKCTEKPKNGAPKKANESEHDRSALLEQIRKGTKLKPINDGAPEKAIDSGIGNILKRRKGIEISSSESEVSDHSDSDDWSNDESKKPKEKKLTKSRKKPTPSNSQPEDERGSKSPDSGHDNIKPEPTTSKVEKPQVPTKPPNLRVSPQTSPAAQVKNVDPVNTSHSINSICELFGGKANKLQKQNIAKRY